MLANATVALYMLLPITLLTSYSLPSGVFYVLLATSFILLAQKHFSGALRQTYNYRWLILSYTLLFVAIAISSMYHREWAGSNSEGALRLFLGLWVLLLALPHIGVQRLRHIAWGMYISGFISTLILLWMIINVDARPGTPGLILTTYTSIMLVLGAVSAYSLKWQLTSAPRLENIFKILVAAMTFGGFFSAQTRTGLLALPLFILLGIVLFVGIKKPIRVLAWAVASAAVLTAAVGFNPTLRERIVIGVNQVQACHDENSTQYNSMCIRLQMWRTAIDAGTNYPWLGLGDAGKFNQYMNEVAVPKGLVAQQVVDEHFGEPHNDLLLVFTGFGFPGLLGLLLIYLAPCAYFLPRLFNKGTTPEARAAAAMGIAICMGFFFFGLTETMFRRMNTIGFYVAMVAWFMVLSDSRTPPKPLH